MAEQQHRAQLERVQGQQGQGVAVTIIRVPESRLVEARAALLAELETRFPLARIESRDAAPGEPYVVRETKFITDTDGKIVGKREVSRVDTAPEPPEAEGALLPFITPAEMRAASAAAYARRSRPGAIEFDWIVAEGALGRPLSPLDHRVLKVAAFTAGGGELGDRLDVLDATIAEAQPALP
jgi:hypothetical protein